MVSMFDLYMILNLTLGIIVFAYDIGTMCEDTFYYRVYHILFPSGAILKLLTYKLPYINKD